MKFELDLFSKKTYFWSQTDPDGTVTVSDEYRVREEMLRHLHKTVDECTVNGTVFQPMIRQNAQEMEWGDTEVVDKHFLLVRGNAEVVGDCQTLDSAIAVAKTFDERVTIFSKDLSKVFYIKE